MTRDGGSQLTKREMENLTFGLSFHYGSATKATRLISALHYADKLANACLGYLGGAESLAASYNEQLLLVDDTRLPSFKALSSGKPRVSFHLHQTA